MKVKWTEQIPLSAIPEEYWGEMSAKDDPVYEGEVIGSGDNFWDGSYLIVACTDNKIRKCPTSLAKIIK